jgi:hypothetical protein
VVLVVALAGLFLTPAGALAYVGPGPGLQMVPRFYSLLGWVGLALAAAVLWPVGGLIRQRWR